MQLSRAIHYKVYECAAKQKIQLPTVGGGKWNVFESQVQF